MNVSPVKDEDRQNTLKILARFLKASVAMENAFYRVMQPQNSGLEFSLEKFPVNFAIHAAVQ